MAILKSIAWIIVGIYVLIVLLLYFFQERLIFYPGRLGKHYRFNLGPMDEEVFLKTVDGQTINALFFPANSPYVILYFHGNAGDLGGWQFVAEDFVSNRFNVLIVDYRGYGKSTGKIFEEGLYIDARTTFHYLVKRGFDESRILIYGRSIGAGVAVQLASEKSCKGLILESPFSSLGALADEKFPFFVPSLYLKYKFDNAMKIRLVKSPVLLLHGSHDSLIPSRHSQTLYDAFDGKKKMIVIDRGAHNDLHTFPRFKQFLGVDLQTFFSD